MELFVSALIAVFFLGKYRKDVDKKTKNASIFRTICFGILSFLVGVFFYKSYQVATVFNSFKIEALRGDYAKTTQDSNFFYCTDKINELNINYRYQGFNSSNSTYRNKLLQHFIMNDDFANNNYFGDLNSYNFEILAGRDSSRFLWNNPKFDKHYADSLGINIDSLENFYKIEFASTFIPSIIPIAISFNSEYNDRFPPRYLYNPVYLPNGEILRTDTLLIPGKVIKCKMEDIEKNPVKFISPSNGMLLFSTNDINFKNASVETLYSGILEGSYKDTSSFLIKEAGMGNLFNKINFWTAADLSQQTLILSVFSDIPISNIALNYDLPIEINSYGEGMTVNANQIYLDNEASGIGPNIFNLMFHIKFPTKANLQAIRSFLLTALLTALISLFFTNLYYVIRKYAMGYKKKHRMPISKLRNLSKSRLYFFRNSLYTIFSIIALLIIVVAFYSLYDIPIWWDVYYTKHHYIVPNLIFALVLVVLLAVIYILYRYATKEVNYNRPNEIDKKQETEES